MASRLNKRLNLRWSFDPLPSPSLTTFKGLFDSDHPLKCLI
nr:MAG TPA: hypothetical protein [Caudoviricetes sp.]